MTNLYKKLSDLTLLFGLWCLAEHPSFFLNKNQKKDCVLEYAFSLSEPIFCRTNFCSIVVTTATLSSLYFLLMFFDKPLRPLSPMSWVLAIIAHFMSFYIFFKKITYRAVYLVSHSSGVLDVFFRFWCWPRAIRHRLEFWHHLHHMSSQNTLVILFRFVIFVICIFVWKAAKL